MRNPVLVERLRATWRRFRLRSTDELGLPADAKEAYLVALLGWLTWHGVPGRGARRHRQPRAARARPAVTRHRSAATTRYRSPRSVALEVVP